MTRQFHQQAWDQAVEDDCRRLVRLAVREDLDRLYDLTTMALVPPEQRGGASFVARQPGTAAGLEALRVCLDEMEIECSWKPLVQDGTVVAAGDTIARIQGRGRDLLTSERILLNLLGRLMGVATLTARYVAAVADHKADIYDTRKTTPGWRRLEKHAVRCGGGSNHRTGLFDAILIKDNHLAMVGAGDRPLTPAAAVLKAREFLAQALPETAETIVEIEVDTLDQLSAVLPAGPDAVLLDNMTLTQLRQAVETRDRVAPGVQLEASGGVNLETVADVAATGVDRISVGALTHSAVSLDVALDWEEGIEN